ncbi:hypothetical protein EVAR_99581_1 [Eumeta japonica]|uniref:Uncharacterized protein n=1 Tax=Eumeta variegata TaxID=151549 RepID=A0A4C1ZGG9_EUMVA|nr:hypothetical protein EVAR_99581_1 [Eumeta japonica]
MEAYNPRLFSGMKRLWVENSVVKNLTRQQQHTAVVKDNIALKFCVSLSPAHVVINSNANGIDFEPRSREKRPLSFHLEPKVKTPASCLGNRVKPSVPDGVSERGNGSLYVLFAPPRIVVLPVLTTPRCRQPTPPTIFLDSRAWILSPPRWTGVFQEVDKIVLVSTAITSGPAA